MTLGSRGVHSICLDGTRSELLAVNGKRLARNSPEKSRPRRPFALLQAQVYLDPILAGSRSGKSVLLLSEHIQARVRAGRYQGGSVLTILSLACWKSDVCKLDIRGTLALSRLFVQT